MTLVKRSAYFRYDFWYRGTRHQGSTEQANRDDAARVEAKVKEQLRQEAWDIAPVDRMRTPSIATFAAYYLDEQRRKVSRPDLVERTLRMALAFRGARPTKSPPVTGGVYHNLRLADPILEPDWIDRFDAWMTLRGIQGSTKNSYRSAMSGMYKLALKPRWRKVTRIKENPFLNIDRDRQRKRKVRLPLDKLRAWIEQADPHVLLAIAIGALAPKLRLTQVLALRFDRHLDPELTTITFEDHNTVRRTGEPQITAIGPDLKLVLDAVRRARPESVHVITYRGEPVKSIKRALKSSATAARGWSFRTGPAPTSDCSNSPAWRLTTRRPSARCGSRRARSGRTTSRGG